MGFLVRSWGGTSRGEKCRPGWSGDEPVLRDLASEVGQTAGECLQHRGVVGLLKAALAQVDQLHVVEQPAGNPRERVQDVEPGTLVAHVEDDDPDGGVGHRPKQILDCHDILGLAVGDEGELIGVTSDDVSRDATVMGRVSEERQLGDRAAAHLGGDDLQHFLQAIRHVGAEHLARSEPIPVDPSVVRVEPDRLTLLDDLAEERALGDSVRVEVPGECEVRGDRTLHLVDGADERLPLLVESVFVAHRAAAVDQEAAVDLRGELQFSVENLGSQHRQVGDGRRFGDVHAELLQV